MVIISMIGGKISAKAELLKAPTRDIIPLRFGIIAAAETETKYRLISRRIDNVWTILFTLMIQLGHTCDKAAFATSAEGGGFLVLSLHFAENGVEAVTRTTAVRFNPLSWNSCIFIFLR